MFGMTKEEGIEQVYNRGRHIVILGAGASIASTFRNAELNRKRLPCMNNFIDLVGLTDIIEAIPKKLQAKNFEKLYSNIHKENPNSEILIKIEDRIKEYFGDMQLPNEPTIYDYLVLSLRGKDLIATFNWDPFLYQAWVRNSQLTNDLPDLSFLHGNVAIGYSKKYKSRGPSGMFFKGGDGLFEPTILLYPVEQKNYISDEFINGEWKRVKYWLSKESGTVCATIFGYGAPTSDIEAVELLKNAWGTSDYRVREQFEIIDTAPEDQLRFRWNDFIHSFHYDITNDYFSSSLACNPRRTIENYFSKYEPQSPKEGFRKNNPIPKEFKKLEELWNWHKPLLEAEEKNKN